MIKQDWIGFVHEINEVEKEFLRHLISYCDSKKEISSEELQDITKLSSSRISQLISTFENYGVISSRHENMGRAGGRRRIIKFANKEAYNEINPLFAE